MHHVSGFSDLSARCFDNRVHCTGDDHTESVALLVAPQWNATYTRVGVPIFIDNEDLFMWIDARGTHSEHRQSANSALPTETPSSWMLHGVLPAETANVGL